MKITKMAMTDNGANDLSDKHNYRDQVRDAQYRSTSAAQNGKHSNMTGSQTIPV